MSSAGEGSLAERIERELERRAGVNAAVEVRGDEVILSGVVDSQEARGAADDIVAELAPDKRLTNDLEVEVVEPPEVTDFYAGEAPAAPAGPGGLVESVEELAEREEDLEPDFTDQPLDTGGLAMAGVDREEEAETTFFPPTDPVVTTDERGEVEVLGGFAPTSDADVGVERSALDGGYGDEAIAEAVRRELRADAATTDLRVDVEVRRGVVHLRGTVPDVDDAENAEEVAGRVPGVVDVVEELRVEGLESAR
jgi:osmotically-inducible protein OsmY